MYIYIKIIVIITLYRLSLYFHYGHRLLSVPKYMHVDNLQSFYETPRQNKKEETLDITKLLILLCLLLRFM